MKFYIGLNITLLLITSFCCHGMRRNITHRKRKSKTERKVASLKIRLRNITHKTHPDFTIRIDTKIQLYKKILTIQSLDSSTKEEYQKKLLIAKLQKKEVQLHVDIERTWNHANTENKPFDSLQEQYTFLQNVQMSLINLYTQLEKTLHSRHKNTVNRKIRQRLSAKIKKIKNERDKKYAHIRMLLEKCYEKVEYENLLQQKKKKYKKLKTEIPKRLERLNTFEETIAIIAAKQHLMQLRLLIDPETCCEYNKELINLERKRCHKIVRQEILEIEDTYPTELNALYELLQKYEKALTYCVLDDVNTPFYKRRCNEIAEECQRATALQKIHNVSKQGGKIKHWKILCGLYKKMQEFCTHNQKLKEQYKKKYVIALVLIDQIEKANRKTFLEEEIKRLEDTTATTTTVAQLILVTQELQTHFERNSAYWSKYGRNLELLKMQQKQLTREKQNRKGQERNDAKLLKNWVTTEDTSTTITIDPAEEKYSTEKFRIGSLLTSSGQITKASLFQTNES